jgi:glycosyltransferase involved in cell wall biosynthesis
MALHAFIVIPMLNEQDTITDTCASLGAFRSATERHFILIDNGSTDRTWAVAQDIQLKSVHPFEVIREQERGHVPPRRTGCRVARDLANARGWSLEQVIVCQADADTIYAEDYVPQMTNAMAAGAQVMYEGRSVLRAENDPSSAIQMYLDACTQTDRLVEHCFAAEDDDVIVDDKVAAYYLSDYFRWGEHQREYSSPNDELLAETTRLYMRARAGGARRTFVNDAFARHSVRRILAETWMHFASAGFPREASWRNQHQSRGSAKQLTADPEAVRIRLNHLLGLFALLPAHVATALGTPTLHSFTKLLPARSLNELRSTPAILLQDVLNVIDVHGDQLVHACARAN